jgi:3-dehydroquinate synthase
VDGRRGSSRVGMSNLVLIGFMGTGKSTLGSLCAERLGYTFRDTDTLIVERAGRSIPQIFAEEGEAGFRARERAIVAELAADHGQVIATGGGAILDPENAVRLRATGCLIALRARPDTVLRRVGDTGSRPLLATAGNPAARIADLLAERSLVYSDHARRCFDTDHLSPSQLAVEIADWYCGFRGEPIRIEVALADRAYPILIEKGILASGSAAEKISESVPARRVCIVTHPGLRAAYVAPIEAGMRSRGISVTTVTIPPGERYKTLKTVARLYNAFLEAGLDRKGLVVAVGGGVLGDITGFAAASYLRGIRVVQVPTTLLAQVDSSVGGKTGVDLPAGKNLVGAFHQPSLVVIDPDTLVTLPARELRSGLAEVIKYGIIYDAGFFDEIARGLPQLHRRAPAPLIQSIVRSCRIKAEVVAQDETEQGLRAILNFGHTVGHALESVTHYRRFKHGEAISIGMVSASMIGESLGVTPPRVTREICRVLKDARLPTAFPADIEPGLILEAARRDKKTEEGQLRFVLARAIGDVYLHNDVPANAIVEALERQRCGEFEHE